MPVKNENQLGIITIDNEVIARIAGLAAMDCYGIVGMAAKNVKDGLVQLLKLENLTRGIKLNITDNKAVIELHIIVEYGTNISAIGESIIEVVKYRVEHYIGIEVLNVNVFVEGVRVDS